MSKSTGTMNLHQKIVKVREAAKGFHKDAKSFNYTYVTGNQILEKIRDTMNELNLLLIPSTELGEHQTHTYVTGAGTPKEKENIDFIVSGKMSYTWIDGDNPEDTLRIEWAYYGQQDEISKAYGSALTYSERYFLLKCLGLPTDEDDPDGRDTSGKTSSSSRDSYSKPKQTPAATDSAGEKMASEKQIKLMFFLAKEKNYEEGLQKYMKDVYGKDKSKDLTSKEISEIIDLLKDMEGE